MGGGVLTGRGRLIRELIRGGKDTPDLDHGIKVRCLMSVSVFNVC